MKRRIFGTNSLQLLAAAALLPLARYSAAQSVESASPNPGKGLAKPGADKSMEISAKTPGSDKSREDNKKNPMSDKSMEISAKAPNTNKSKVESQKSSFFQPDAALDKRRLALAHLFPGTLG